MLDVFVNGNKVSLASVHTENVGTQRVTTATMDEKALLERIQKEGESPVITISIDTPSDKAQGCFSAQAVQKMGEKGVIIELKTPEGRYRVPASEISTHELVARLGKILT